jgi:hypothetical protein
LTKGTEALPESFPLYAGQHDLVGEVLVWDDGTELCVKYQLSDDALAEGWLLYETHLAVATDADDIPQTKKHNPIPGQFPYGDDNLGGVEFYPECISFEDLEVECGVELVIAAHAVIEKTECEVIVLAGENFIVSDTSTKVTAGNNIGDAVLAWVHPQWKLLVDDTGLIEEPAKWIWESYYVVNPVLGDEVTFEKTFEVPGTPVSGGTLYIVCDNSYDVYLNGVLLGSHDVWWEKKVYYLDPPVLKQGTNTLRIVAVNAPQTGGTEESNPGGVKFSFCAHWDAVEECATTDEETAWAGTSVGQIQFAGKNWATYFNYTTNECE